MNINKILKLPFIILLAFSLSSYGMEEGDSEFSDHDESDSEFGEYGQTEDEYSDHDESDDGFDQRGENLDGDYILWDRSEIRKKLIEESAEFCKSRPVKSLIDIIISKYAKEAVVLYDQNNGNFDLLIQYINDKFKEIGSHEICGGFLNVINKIIVRDCKRADIFGKEFVRLYVVNEDKSLCLNFFNNFSEDIKFAIAEWLIMSLINYRDFDAMELTKCEGCDRNPEPFHYHRKDKEILSDILTLVFKQPHSIEFCDEALKAFYKIIKHEPLIISAPSQDSENTLSHKWDEQENLIILTTNADEGQQIADRFVNVFEYILELRRPLEKAIKLYLKEQIKKKEFEIAKLYDEELSAKTAELKKIIKPYFEDSPEMDDEEQEQYYEQKFSEIGIKIEFFTEHFDKAGLEKFLDYLFLTKPKFLCRLMDNEIIHGRLALDFMTFIYPDENDLDMAIERIFEMLYKHFKEYSEIIHYRNLRNILKPRMLIMSRLVQDLSGLVTFKLAKLIKNNDYDKAFKELYRYFERFGLEFVKKIIAKMPGHIKCVESSKQLFILDNFAKILSQFVKHYGLNEQALASELERLAYLNKWYLRRELIEFFYFDIEEEGLP